MKTSGSIFSSCTPQTFERGVAHIFSQEEPAPSIQMEQSTAVKVEAESAAAEDVAMEAADVVEGADQQAAATSVPGAAEAALELPAGIVVKREPEVELPRRRSKRLKQEP